MKKKYKIVRKTLAFARIIKKLLIIDNTYVHEYMKKILVNIGAIFKNKKKRCTIYIHFFSKENLKKSLFKKKDRNDTRGSHESSPNKKFCFRTRG